MVVSFVEKSLHHVLEAPFILVWSDGVHSTIQSSITGTSPTRFSVGCQDADTTLERIQTLKRFLKDITSLC